MKPAIVIILSIFLIFLMVQVYSFSRKEKAASEQNRALEAQVNQLEKESESLKNDYKYYSDPANFEKELRARFNYKSLGEKMIIIVPKQSSSTTSTNN